MWNENDGGKICIFKCINSTFIKISAALNNKKVLYEVHEINKDMIRAGELISFQMISILCIF